MTAEIQNLLNQTGLVLKHHSELQKIKGESFNVFSVLNMETRENATHSAFLAELLNPYGSHLKGTLFLELFIKMLKDSTEGSEASIKFKPFDIETAKIIVEKKIDDLNSQEMTGGRVDIYLKDGKGYSLCIENKINAADQYAQIQRYYNHNSKRNTVIYLNLYGSDPSEESMQKLIPHVDFFIISYRDHIINWLSNCQKETVDIPIIRESIRQYILLIKKLTGVMNDKAKKELHNLILNNYEEAKKIADNIDDAYFNVSRDIKSSVFKQLEEKIGEEFNLYEGKDVNSSYSQIWVKVKGKEETKIFFGIQSFARRPNDFGNKIFVGIFVKGGVYTDEYSDLGKKYSDWWLGIERIPNLNETPIHLRNIETIKNLHFDPDFKKAFVDQIVNTSIEYIERNKEKVKSKLKSL